MVLRRPASLLIGLAALTSVFCFASLPGDGFHPLAVLASLLPLQLAALLWVLLNTQAASPTEAAPLPPARRPPASDGSRAASRSAPG